jgi:hypothetical protein
MSARGSSRGVSNGLLVAALLLASAAGAREAAATPAQCQGSWTAPAGECTFTFTGFPIRVFGDTTGVVGEPLDVLVWVGPATLVTIGVSCLGSSMSGTASCSREFGSDVPGSLPEGAPVTCHVTGRTSGTFGCSSGLYAQAHSCSASWFYQSDCTFTSAGSALHVAGNASSGSLIQPQPPDAFVFLRVAVEWIDLQQSPPVVRHLAMCAGAGVFEASCSGDFATGPPAGTELRCIVVGKFGGGFSCSSG